MVRGADDILRAVAQQRVALRRVGVRHLAFWGSCARGEHHAASDLDFPVEVEHKTFNACMDFKLLESTFDCPVDVVLADAVNPPLREAILREAVDAPGL